MWNREPEEDTIFSLKNSLSDKRGGKGRCGMILTGEQLSIGYNQGRRGNTIVHAGLSFALREGEMTCLLGQNGTGKSTLLRTVSGALKPLAGTLNLYGKAMSAYSHKELSKLLGIVLTDRALAGGLTVWEVVSLGRHPHTGFFGQLTDEDNEVIQRSLEQTGIAEKAGQYFAELSDGMRQKVLIAKVLAQECPLLVLDEPTAFLDVISRIEIMNLLHDLAVTQRKTILLSTHDLEQACLLGDRLWLLSDAHDNSNADTNALQCGVTEDLVFSGAMNRAFAKDNISFDPLSGGFRAQKTFDTSKNIHYKKVYVEAADEVLLFWTKNALRRRGFEVTERVEDVTENHVRVKVLSPQEIILDGKTIKSFEALKNVGAGFARPM
ncbi:iron(III) ABC transporter ATP-binding protein [Bacteroidia bacterium]|nr:iron(III) ABC transporter ATP-binding protein [Bacteroidia bacterium]